MVEEWWCMEEGKERGVVSQDQGGIKERVKENEKVISQDRC